MRKKEERYNKKTRACFRKIGRACDGKKENRKFWREFAAPTTVWLRICSSILILRLTEDVDEQRKNHSITVSHARQWQTQHTARPSRSLSLSLYFSLHTHPFSPHPMKDRLAHSLSFFLSHSLSPSLTLPLSLFLSLFHYLTPSLLLWPRFRRM